MAIPIWMELSDIADLVVDRACIGGGKFGSLSRWEVNILLPQQRGRRLQIPAQGNALGKEPVKSSEL